MKQRSATPADIIAEINALHDELVKRGPIGVPFSFGEPDNDILRRVERYFLVESVSSESARAALAALDRLEVMKSIKRQNVEHAAALDGLRVIALLLDSLAEGALNAKKKPRRKTAVENPTLSNIRSLVRGYRQQGFSYAKICEVLNDHSRPPGAEWKHLTWPKAWKSRYKPAVKSWLNRASRPVKQQNTFFQG